MTSPEEENAAAGGGGQEWFTAAHVMQLTGCSYRQLDHWGRAGYLQSQIPPNGSGSVRLYHRTQVDTVTAALALIELGFATAPALRLAQQLGDGPVVLGGGFVTIGGHQ